jgi:unsaturated rhamnogalacturonyl hydrolase
MDRSGRALTALLAMQRQSWEQGLAGQAALDLGRDDLVALLADAAVVRQAPDGRLGTVEDERGAVNGAACGEAVLHAARADGTGRYSNAVGRQLDWLLHAAPRAADGVLFHELGRREVWADTVYMVLPLLAVTGHVDVAVTQLLGHRRRLHDDRTGLSAARWDEDTASLSHPEHWGAATGWVAAGIARALRVTTSWPAGPRLHWAAHVRDLVDACVGHRRPDGLFGNVLDEPSSFRETNVAQMVAYAAGVGAADGWLPPSYRAIARDLFAAATRCVDERGLVTGACGSPRFDTPGVSAEAQAFHVLAAAVD